MGKVFQSLLAVCLLIPNLAQAEERKIAGRSVQYYTKMTPGVSTGQSGRMRGKHEVKGITFGENGDISTNFGHGSFELVDGEGTHEGMLYRTFDDGSTIIVRYNGRVWRENKRGLGEGSFKCVKGSGRFKEIKCDGSYHAVYFENGFTVTDWKGKALLPDTAEGGKD